MYADDLILISISVVDLQSLINLCVDVFCDLDLPINNAKCECTPIGPRHKSQVSVHVQNHILSLVDNLKFLGVTLTCANAFKLSWSEAKSKFFSLLWPIQSCGDLVISSAKHSIQTRMQGMQNLLEAYGTSSVSLCNRELNNHQFAYNSFCLKMF